MGYTIYYKISLRDRSRMLRVLKPIVKELGFEIYEEGDIIVIKPDHNYVEPLIIKNGEWMGVKTYKREPFTAIYKLILLSLFSFGSVELFDDEGWPR